MFCRNCGKEINDKAEYCTGCGCSPLSDTTFCQECGAETNAKQEICIKCGVRLRKSNSISGSIMVLLPVVYHLEVIWFY